MRRLPRGTDCDLPVRASFHAGRLLDRAQCPAVPLRTIPRWKRCSGITAPPVTPPAASATSASRRTWAAACSRVMFSRRPRR
ncbi:MAG: hypothetical protein MZV64_19900 [Ignavibacteriales bacterium]|nr:hypothetical protein [Ignavibacteriales bacterium]